jgi:hypothetical protein
VGSSTNTTTFSVRAAVGHLADRLEVHASYSNVLSVRATLHDVCKSLRTLLP